MSLNPTKKEPVYEYTEVKNKPIVLKPIKYEDSVPDVLKYHSNTVKTILHPQTTVIPTNSLTNKLNSSKQNFNNAFEVFINKPSYCAESTKNSPQKVKEDSKNKSEAGSPNSSSTLKTVPVVNLPPITQTCISKIFNSTQNSQCASSLNQTSNLSIIFPDEKKRIAYPAASKQVSAVLSTIPTQHGPQIAQTSSQPNTSYNQQMVRYINFI